MECLRLVTFSGAFHIQALADHLNDVERAVTAARKLNICGDGHDDVTYIPGESYMR